MQEGPGPRRGYRSQTWAVRVTVAAVAIIWLVYGPISLVTDHGQHLLVADLGITLAIPAIGVVLLLFSRFIDRAVDRSIAQRVSRLESMSPLEREDELRRVLARLDQNAAARTRGEVEILHSLLDDDRAESK